MFVGSGSGGGGSGPATYVQQQQLTHHPHHHHRASIDGIGLSSAGSSSSSSILPSGGASNSGSSSSTPSSSSGLSSASAAAALSSSSSTTAATASTTAATSSRFNKFAQADRAAAFWLVTWFSLNVGTTLLGKAIFTNFSFPYPITMCIVHMVATALLTRVQMWLTKVPLARLTWRESIYALGFSTIFCANIVVGNSSIRHASVALVQVVRAIIPGITMCLSVPLLGARFTAEHVAAVLVVAVGVALAAYGDIECTTLGLTLTVVGCLLASLKGITAKAFLSGRLQLDPLDLAYRMSTMAGVQMVLLAYWFDEFGAIEAAGAAASYEHIYYVLAFHGVMAFFLNYSNFSLTRHTSALAVSVAGSVKNAATILLSIVLFATPVTPLNAVGTIVAIAGAAWYTKVEYRESQHREQLKRLASKEMV